MRTDPGDVVVWGCALASGIVMTCITAAVVAGTYAFAVWCFS